MLIETPSVDSVITFSQSLSQWAVVIVGGTTAVLLGNSHLSPHSRRLRSSYLLFLPAWVFLLLSTWMGVKVQKNFLALKLLAKVDAEGAKIDMNQHLGYQLSYMQLGLVFIGIWLVFYLFWWVFVREVTGGGKAVNEKNS